MPETKKEKNRWYRISLRALMILFVVSSIGLAWLSAKMRQAKIEHAVVEKHCARGYMFCNVYFAYQSGMANNKTGTPPAPAFLRRISADNLFSPIKSIVTGVDEAVEIFDEPIELDHLEFISIRYATKLKGLGFLSRCPNLKTLQVVDSRFDSIDDLKFVPKLNHLTLSGTQVTSIESLAKMKELETIKLRFRKTRLKSIEPLLDLPKLKHLHFDYDGDPRELEVLCKLKTLESLNLQSRYSFSHEEVDNLKAELPNVKLKYNGI